MRFPHFSFRSNHVTPWSGNGFPQGSLTPQEEAAVQSRVDGIIGHESRGNPRAQNRLSSAGGLGQFIDSTWLQYARKVAPTLRGMSDAQVLSLKKDASPQGQAFQRTVLNDFTRDNAIRLKNAGLPINAATLYSVHFSGDTKIAEAAARGDRTTVGRILGPAAARANPTLAYLSPAQFMQRFGKEPGGAGAPIQVAKEDPNRPGFRLDENRPSLVKTLAGNQTPAPNYTPRPLAYAEERSQFSPRSALAAIERNFNPISRAEAAEAPSRNYTPPPSYTQPRINPADPSGPLLPDRGAPAPIQAPPMHVGRQIGPVAPSAPLPPMANDILRNLPASLAGARMPNITPTPAPIQAPTMNIGRSMGPPVPPTQLGDAHIGRNMGPTAPAPIQAPTMNIGRQMGPTAPSAPLPGMNNSAPRAMPTGLAGIPIPKITPTSPHMQLPDMHSGRKMGPPAPAAPLPPMQNGAPRAMPANLAGAPQSKIVPASAPAPVSAPPASKEQVAQPKIAPPGTHNVQYGPNSVLIDNKTGAPVNNLKGWDNASPAAKAINGDAARPPAPAPVSAPQPIPAPAPPSPAPVGPRVVQLPPMDIGKPYAGPPNDYHPATPQLAPTTPPFVPDQPTPMVTPLTQDPSPPTVTPESISDPGPIFTQDPAPQIDISGGSGGGLGGGESGPDMSAMMDALDGLGGGGEGGGGHGGGGAEPMHAAPHADFPEVGHFPEVGADINAFLTQRGAMANAPTLNPYQFSMMTPFSLKGLGQAGQMQQQQMPEGFASSAVKRLFG